MIINDVIKCLEDFAPPLLQEFYDNAGLLTGNVNWPCTGIVTALDATEEVVMEAVDKKANLITAHHPIIFKGLKKITGNNYIEKAVIAAIKNDIAIYAIHTNLDNVLNGVNNYMADKLGLINRSVLEPRQHTLKKFVTFVPLRYADAIRDAIFNAGGGNIGKYSECSFSATGEGTFKAGPGTQPFAGGQGERHTEPEIKIESVFPAWLQNAIVTAAQKAHPYEEMAYDIISLGNAYTQVGAGLAGDLEQPIDEKEFLQLLKNKFNTPVIRHTDFTGRPVKKVALCGGAGSFLINTAVAAGADFYITADIKYHEFFDANGKMVLADIGHYESEQFTIDLLFDILKEKFPTFAVLKTGVVTNPVHYF